MDKSLKAVQRILHNEFGIEVRKSELLRYAIAELDMFDMDCNSNSLRAFFDASISPGCKQETAAEIVCWMVPSHDEDVDEWIPDIDE